MKYDELIKDLRICASTFCESCEKCSHSNEHGDCYNGLERSAADAIEGLLAVIQRQKEMINATAYLPLYPKPMKWIPVTERLPEEKGYYLMFSHGVIGTAYYGSKWWTEDPRIYEPQITHWMTMLPEPPKEETDG